jgi:2-oxoglutarate ferredoxin oxidoreductase subunit alpha
MDTNIRVAGEAGQGVLTTGNLLVGSLARTGLHVLSTQSYMSRIRGGLNWFDIRISDGELFSGIEDVDVLVALTPTAYELLRDQVTPDGVILFNGTSSDGVVGLEFTKIARELAGSPLMANTVAAGAVFGILGYDVEQLCKYLTARFGKKGQDIVGAPNWQPPAIDRLVPRRPATLQRRYIAGGTLSLWPRLRRASSLPRRIR